VTAAIVPKFTGTSNPRELRAIHALNIRPMPREHLDKFVGCSNGPDLISRLRHKGLEIPCEKVSDTDRDGLPIMRGVYHLSTRDRRAIGRWQARKEVK
jgi:hypothetical protein